MSSEYKGILGRQKRRFPAVTLEGSKKGLSRLGKLIELALLVQVTSKPVSGTIFQIRARQCLPTLYDATTIEKFLQE